MTKTRPVNPRTVMLQEMFPRKILTIEEICAKYPWVVPESLKGKGNNRTIVIQCQEAGCAKTRRTRTSSAYQVRFCRKHQRERDLALLALRRKRWKERDRAKRRAMREGEA